MPSLNGNETAAAVPLNSLMINSYLCSGQLSQLSSVGTLSNGGSRQR